MGEDDSGHNSSGYNDCKTYTSADQSSLVTDSHSSDSRDGENEDEADDPQNKYRASVNETCLELACSPAHAFQREKRVVC